MTDNGPAFKSLGFARFTGGRVELEHVRTHHHAPETNAVVERFNQSLKYEQLYRLEIRDVLALHAACEGYRRLHNEVRPPEALGFELAFARYLEEPEWPRSEPHLSEAESVQVS